MAFSDIFKSTQYSLMQKAKQALDWMKSALKGMTGDQRTDFTSNTPSVGRPEIGKMYFFMYPDPKTKKTLPYYDLFPLIFCINDSVDLQEGKGFMGLNMHYLPPRARAALMDALDTIKNNDKYDDTTKLEISYTLLKEYGEKFGGYESCIKLYYYSRVKGSRLYYIQPKDWAFVVMLPLHQWVVNPNKRYAGTPPF